MTRNELLQSSLDQLEFYRILEHIAGFAASSLGVEDMSEAGPYEDVDLARRELRMVGEIRLMLQRDQPVPLDGIYDIRQALSVSKISGAYLGGENLLHVASTIGAQRKVKEYFSARRDASPLLHGLSEHTHTNRLLEKHISEAIDDSGNVKDNASRDLFRIRRDIIDKSASLRTRLQKILRRVSDEELVTDEYVTLREGRLVLPVKVESKRKIPGIIHGESQSGGTVFLEPAEIFDMNNEIAELTFAERREVERILRTLTEEVGSEAVYFLEGMELLKRVDSCNARARYAQKYDCVEPDIADDDRLLLRDAFHPLLQTRLDNVVPMSIEMDPATRCVVISGPNAGGKTVAMKTLGLVAMMALSGIHPPAAECIVHPCILFSDIGDQQSVENDLSTFSSHMSRISEIIRHVSPGDIILLDEIGTGTDPDEGGAIAASILEHLLARRAFILATTHHSFLKIFAYETESVVNGGMEFDTRTITPTYRFIIGMPGNSYAFELIERLGFERKILTDAREKLGEERNRMTEIIGQLEVDLAESRRMRDEHRQQRDEAESIRKRYEAEAKDFAERKQTIIAEAKSEARATLAKANGMIENAIREIRSGATNDQVKQLRRTIDDAREGLTDVPQATDDRERFHKGDTVRIKGGAQIGELQFDPDDKGNVVVQFGGMRMRSHIDDLEAVTRKEVRKESAGRKAIVNVSEAETRIDLRGMYADEAVIRLEQAISAALSSNIANLEIIHGKGTGALRKRVHDFLADHPSVANYRIGALTEGGAGVTIVELN
ncbi:MAG: endonuclease MutS2 [Bacteroidota bacterium]